MMLFVSVFGGGCCRGQGLRRGEREILLTAATSPMRRSRCCSKYVFSVAVEPFVGAISAGNDREHAHVQMKT
jgi:hypothetical protein